MAGEEQYYNPIIQAMVASANQQRQQEQLKQEAAKLKSEESYRQAHLDFLKNQEAHHTELEGRHLDIQKALSDVQQQIGSLQRMKLGHDLIMGGTTQEQINQNLPQGQQFQGLPSPQDLQAAEANRFRAEASARAEGTLPSQLTLLGEQQKGAKELKQLENQFLESLTDKKIASSERIAKLSRDTQVQIANATNATHLKVAGMQYVPSPENLRAMVVAGMTGQAKLNFANPQERAALSTIQELGGREIDPKEAQALKEGQALVPLFDKLRTFADKLPTSRLSAFGAGKTLQAANAIGFPTKTQNELNNINSQALVIGRAVEGLTGGRVLSKQLELDLNSLASGGITRDDALSRLHNLQDLYTNKQEQQIMGGMPQSQKELIYNTYGIKPSWLFLSPKKNKAGHLLDEAESIKRGQPVYVE